MLVIFSSTMELLGYLLMFLSPFFVHLKSYQVPHVSTSNHSNQANLSTPPHPPGRVPRPQQRRAFPEASAPDVAARGANQWQRSSGTAMAMAVEKCWGKPMGKAEKNMDYDGKTMDYD